MSLSVKFKINYDHIILIAVMGLLKEILMKRFCFTLIFGMGLLFLSACTAKTTPTTVPEETETAVATALPTATQPVAAEPVENYCITCHTDKQMLIDTAEPVAEVAEESESEGVG
jgi:hypothetical protein